MLSIIIPTLNEENYLPLLLESITRATARGEEEGLSSSPRKQEFKNYEVIVADANSEDKTKEIAKEYGCRLTKGGGNPAKGRNEGAKIARGDLFLFLDADIIIPEDFLEKSLGEFKKRKLDVASYCLIPQTDNSLIKFAFNLLYNWLILILQNILPHAAMGILVKREVFDRVGGFNEEIKMAEDHFFARQASKFSKFGVINSTKIYITLRRYEKDGYFSTYFKYFLCEFYMLSGKPAKSNLFKYKFDQYSKKQRNQLK